MACWAKHTLTLLTRALLGRPTAPLWATALALLLALPALNVGWVLDAYYHQMALGQDQVPPLSPGRLPPGRLSPLRASIGGRPRELRARHLVEPGAAGSEGPVRRQDGSLTSGDLY
jgi:hypothetical protein